VPARLRKTPPASPLARQSLADDSGASHGHQQKRGSPRIPLNRRAKKQSPNAANLSAERVTRSGSGFNISMNAEIQKDRQSLFFQKYVPTPALFLASNPCRPSIWLWKSLAFGF
jgi:hypothetical protein